jgi:hypothetical protein
MPALIAQARMTTSRRIELTSRSDLGSAFASPFESVLGAIGDVSARFLTSRAE